jgi:Ni,Fe-hydrogenase III large subunit
MNTILIETSNIRRSAGEFFEFIRNSLSGDGRLVTFYGGPDDDESFLVLTAVIEVAGQLHAAQTSVPRGTGFHTLTRDFPAIHIFEREVFEQHGLKPHDHPWLKPVRFSGELQGKIAEYPFYRVDGKEVHEVGVGPIHAGVIEPGHFRFMCLGETVHHLEIQLGFQHRGVEALLLARPAASLTPLVETIVGDSSVAHAWAYCAALENLSGAELPHGEHVSRGVALELERIAMHLGSLSGLCTDIAFLQGGATYGRLRTTVINTTMLLCGSRFGRGWLRPGGSRATMTAATATTVRENLAFIKRDIAIINRHFLGAATVRHRLNGVGTLTKEQAVQIGLVGMAARSTGVAVDGRCNSNGLPPYSALRARIVVESSGDCWARAVLRIREIDESLEWLEAALEECPTMAPTRSSPQALRPGALSISVCEGWRGEVVHCLETNATGSLRQYRVQDPSLRNWFGVALAVRENDIYDFPICNKSFDLSYCGNDL